MSKLLDGWKKFVGRMNEKGIPVPTIRDPKTGFGSISLTLVFTSSILVIVGIIGKWSKFAGTIDVNNALEFFYASSALYFGRNWGSKSGAKMVQAEQPQPQPAPPKDDLPS